MRCPYSRGCIQVQERPEKAPITHLRVTLKALCKQEMKATGECWKHDLRHTQSLWQRVEDVLVQDK